MKKQLIKDLRIGDEVETQVLVVEVTKVAFTSSHRAGEYFLKLNLADVSGRIKAVMWDPPASGEPVTENDVIFISGSVTDYHGPQIVVNELRKLDPSKVNRSFFQPVSPRNLNEMIAELKGIVENYIDRRELQDLLSVFIDDEVFFSKFTLAPAARTVHHNYISGLIEHTLEVVNICRNLAALYPGRINESLLLTGAILHDMGKIEEYNLESIGFAFTDRGKLIGHISIGKEMLDKKIATMPSFPSNLKDELEHMLLSHHGVREWGSPEVPKTINAFALFHADLLSARMGQFLSVIDKHPVDGGRWTEWDRFLERSVCVFPENETDL